MSTPGEHVGLNKTGSPGNCSLILSEATTAPSPNALSISSQNLAPCHTPKLSDLEFDYHDVKGVYKNCRGIWAAQWTDENGQRHTKYFNPKFFSSEIAARVEAYRFKVKIQREIELKGGGTQKRKSSSVAAQLDGDNGRSFKRSDGVVPRRIDRRRPLNSIISRGRQMPGQFRFSDSDLQVNGMPGVYMPSLEEAQWHQMRYNCQQQTNYYNPQMDNSFLIAPGGQYCSQPVPFMENQWQTPMKNPALDSGKSNGNLRHDVSWSQDLRLHPNHQYEIKNDPDEFERQHCQEEGREYSQASYFSSEEDGRILSCMMNQNVENNISDNKKTNGDSSARHYYLFCDDARRKRLELLPCSVRVIWDPDSLLLSKFAKNNINNNLNKYNDGQDSEFNRKNKFPREDIQDPVSVPPPVPTYWPYEPSWTQTVIQTAGFPLLDSIPKKDKIPKQSTTNTTSSDISARVSSSPSIHDSGDPQDYSAFELEQPGPSILFSATNHQQRSIGQEGEGGKRRRELEIGTDWVRENNLEDDEPPSKRKREHFKININLEDERRNESNFELEENLLYRRTEIPL